ncbi:MAG: hypothetical protein JWN25_3178 [Verrucomicrobiales bacterium]|nr:hypothetical protein [Verrucomicrobiales bacterium]
MFLRRLELKHLSKGSPIRTRVKEIGICGQLEIRLLRVNRLALGLESRWDSSLVLRVGSWGDF